MRKKRLRGETWEGITVTFHQAPPPKVFTVRTTLSAREPLEGTLKPCANHSPPQILRFSVYVTLDQVGKRDALWDRGGE